MSKHYYSDTDKLIYSEEYRYNFDRFNRQEDRRSTPNLLPSEYNIFTVNNAFSYFYVQKVYTRSCLLDTIIRTTYPSNASTSPIVEKIILSYNNANQLIGKELVLPNGIVISEKTRYLYDMGSSPLWGDFYNGMWDRGLRGYPIKTQRRISGKGIVAATHNDYENVRNNGNPLYRLTRIKATEIDSPLNFSDFSEAIDDYLKVEREFAYDNQGNLIESKLVESNITTTYFWGYNQQYPIVEVRGKTREEIESSLSGSDSRFYIQIASDAGDNDDKIRSFGEMLRRNLSDALVNTYTYKPLVGITSQTDPRGITTYYAYDRFGRLTEAYIIEDGKKKILQVFEYNYRFLDW